MRPFRLGGALVALALLPLAAPASAQATPASADALGVKLSWQLSPTQSTSQYRGLSVVSSRVVWAGGTQGSVLRTVDGGRSWRQVGPPDTKELQFRDIEAFDADHAVALAIGEGQKSRVYTTADGGTSWKETFRNPDPKAFYDCMAFFDRNNGLAMSDPVDGKFRVLSTGDGGASWQVVPPEGMPPALPNEAAFAASGQCLVTSGSRDAWIASGGGAKARVFHSSDRGRTWQVSDTPLASKPTAGVFALAFRDRRHGLAIGGDFEAPAAAVNALATTGDAGRSWKVPPQAPKGYRSGATYLPYLPTVVLAVGPTGSDISIDDGRHWRQFDEGSFDTVDCGWDGACWAAGEKGRIGRLHLGW